MKLANGRARDVRPFGLPRLHGGFLSARTASALGVVLLEPARRRIEPRGQLVLEELDLVADREEVVPVAALVVADVLRRRLRAKRLAAAVARHVPGWWEREHVLP